MSGLSGIISLQTGDWNLKSHLLSMHRRIGHRGGLDEGICIISGEESYDVEQFYGSKTPQAIISNLGLKHIDQVRNEPKIGLAQHQSYPNDPVHFPYYDNEAGIVVLFDGRILNKTYLIKELYRDNPDVQQPHLGRLLIDSYQKWGENIGVHISGRFVLVFLDLREHKVMVVRDPFGVKPLYFFQTENYFGFASELKAFFPLSFVSKRLDRVKVFNYLAYGQTEQGSATFFKHIQELSPGHAMSFLIKNKIAKQWGYFRLTTDGHFGKYKGSQNAGYNHKIKRLLASSIQNHLQNLDQFAILNDGGFGAGAIAYLIRLYEREVKAGESYGKHYLEPYYGEYFAGDSKFARDLLKNLKGTPEPISINADVNIQTIEQVIYQQDIPFNSYATILNYKLAEAVKSKGLPTIFMPHGYEFLFGGSPDHFAMHLFSSFRKGYYNEFFVNWFNVSSRFLSKSKLLSLVLGKWIWNKDVEQLRTRHIFPNTLEYNIIKAGFWDKNIKKSYAFEEQTIDSLNQYLLTQYTGGIFRQILRTTDRNFSAFAQDYDLPFAMDKELAQLLFKIQSVYKIRYGLSAMMLRRSMKDIMPDNLMYQHISVKLHHYFSYSIFEHSKQFKPYFNSDLDDYLNVDYIHNNWDKIFSLSGKASPEILWRLVNFAIWRKIYLYDKE